MLKIKYWDWEHRMTMNCREREKDPHLILEDSEKKILLVDMTCLMEVNRN